MPDVEFQANGGTAPGYLAVPESGSGPGVVVLQEWWGLEDHIKDVTDRFAAEGFVAMAPDLYRGETTDQPDEAQQKMMAMNVDQAEKDLRGAVDYVSEHEAYDGSGIGTVGFCLGGALAVWAGTLNPKVDAVVSFYYVMPHAKPDFSKLDAPVLGALRRRGRLRLSRGRTGAGEGDRRGHRPRRRVRLLRRRGPRVLQRHRPAGHLPRGPRQDGLARHRRLPEEDAQAELAQGWLPAPRSNHIGRSFVMNALAADPQAAARQVEPDEPITVCPWPGVVHISLTQGTFRLWRPGP